MNETGTTASFIEKWRTRWPEWSVAEAFLPAADRQVAETWFALLQEFSDAAWSGSDPTPGLAKLAWWHDEMEGWAKGARRHPLGGILQRQPAPWTALGRALNALPATRDQASGDAREALTGLAAAIVGCEQALFPGPSAGPAAEDDDAAGFAALCLLGERALLTGARDDAGELLRQWPQRPAGTRVRRLQGALLRSRLATLAKGAEPVPLPGWRVLASSWRAARGR